jgi:hypothetical protein
VGVFICIGILFVCGTKSSRYRREPQNGWMLKVLPGLHPCAFRSPHEWIDEAALDRDNVCGAWELIGPASGWN